MRHKRVALFSDSASSVQILKKLYTRSVSLRSTLGRIVQLVRRFDITLDAHHIAGELNSLADQLSRTVERNRYVLHPSALHSCRLRFDFDLYGSSLSSLAPAYCTALTYRARKLQDCPPRPALSVAAPPWPQLLPLLSAAAAGHANHARVLLIAPYWPAQPWWPLLQRLSEGKLLMLPGKPWVSPGGRRA